jgi:nitrogen fixation protein NifZ
MNTPMQTPPPAGTPSMVDLRETRAPRYPWGLPVVATRHLYNDGSLPDAEPDALLVARGGPGEIANVGHHDQSNQPIYMVDFGSVVLGCLEHEIWPQAEPLPPLVEDEDTEDMAS